MLYLNAGGDEIVVGDVLPEQDKSGRNQKVYPLLKSATYFFPISIRFP